MTFEPKNAGNEHLLELIRHILFEIWNPIGLQEERLRDEYDRYAWGLVRLVLSQNAFEDEIAEYLLHIEVEEMGLPPAPPRALRAARALLGLREAVQEKERILQKQVVSSDGQRCLWIWKRPDGFYVYERVILRNENDENGAWSWWTRPDQTQSGLYESAEAAERDASTATSGVSLD